MFTKRAWLALFAGALLPLAFAPIHIWMLAFISPAILFSLWLSASPKHCFWLGWLFGMGLFGVGSSWIYISIHQFGHANVLLASLVTLAFVLVLGLYPALHGFLTRIIWKYAKPWQYCLLIWPASWALCEYVRCVFADGFPFLLLGYTQLHTPLAGFVPVVGVYGVSLLVALFSGALVMTRVAKQHRTRSICVMLMVLIGFAGWLLRQHHWTQLHGNAQSISLIQGNIAQSDKWDNDQLVNILQTYRGLSQSVANHSIVVWPEAAIPYYPSLLPAYMQQLNQLANQQHSTYVVGAPLLGTSADTVYNGLLVLGHDKGRYNKRHLVPFGEFIPLQHIFGRLMALFSIPLSSLTPGNPIQPPISLNTIPTALFICYETAFSNDVLQAMQHKQFAINIVDDAWFGHSFAAAQQLQMTQFRAKETGRYIAVTANTGITAIIDPQGAIVDQLPQHMKGILSGQIRAMRGDTPLMQWQYWPVAILVLLMLFIPVCLQIFARFWLKHK